MNVLFDEKIDGQLFRQHRERVGAAHNTRVVDHPDLGPGTSDQDILSWALQHEHALVTEDSSMSWRELPEFYKEHETQPCVVLLRNGYSIVEALDLLQVLNDPEIEWEPGPPPIEIKG